MIVQVLLIKLNAKINFAKLVVSCNLIQNDTYILRGRFRKEPAANVFWRQWNLLTTTQAILVMVVGHKNALENCLF